MKAMTLLGVLGLGLLALGCGDNPEPASHVEGLRVLAQQADLPFAHPGETVQLQALSYDADGRDLTWAWASCENPAKSDLAGCLGQIAMTGDPATAVFAMGANENAPTVAVPNDTLSKLPPQAREAASLGLVSAACPGDLSIGQGPGGLPFVCQEPGTKRELLLGEFIVGYKRIWVRETDRNQNPEIARVTFDGEDWPSTEIKEVTPCDRDDSQYAPCSADSKHHIAAELTPESFEAGTDELGVSFTEVLVLQYYATDGMFEFDSRIGSSPETGFAARRGATGQTLRLWLLARDDRGGVGWAERQVRVTASK